MRPQKKVIAGTSWRASLTLISKVNGSVALPQKKNGRSLLARCIFASGTVANRVGTRRAYETSA